MQTIYFDYKTEQKRFIIELVTGITLEDWHKNNLLLQDKLQHNKSLQGTTNLVTNSSVQNQQS